MHTRTAGAAADSPRGPITLAALSLSILLGTGACAATPPSSPSAAAQPIGSATLPSVSAAPQVAQGGDWNGFRGDASRSAVGLQGPTGNPVLNWQFKAGGAVPNQVAIVGDAVYFASDDGTLHAVNGTTGAEMWKQALKSGTTTGPVVSDGLIYLVDEQGAVLALDPSTGSGLWQSASRYDGATQLISTDGSLYLGTGEASSSPSTPRAARSNGRSSSPPMGPRSTTRRPPTGSCTQGRPGAGSSRSTRGPTRWPGRATSAATTRAPPS
jgi:hypothetical protein